MTKQAFLISVLTAASLGYTAGFATDGLTAKAAVSVKQADTLQEVLTTGQQSSLESLTTNVICSKFESKYGASTCRVDTDLGTACFNWRSDGKVELEAGFLVGGSFTPGSPE